MPLTEPTFPHRPFRLEYCSKVSLATLFVAGVLVCTTAYANAQTVQQAPSKVKVAQQQPLVVGVNQGKSKSSLSAGAKTSNAPLLYKDTKNPTRFRTQSDKVFSRTQEKIPGLNAAKTPPPPSFEDPDSPAIYISGLHMDGAIESQMRVRGRGQLIRGETVVQGEELVYNGQTEVVSAEGDVRLNYEGGIFEGTKAELHLPSQQGYFDAKNYRISQTGAHGDTTQIQLTGANKFSFQDANYTLCEPDEAGKLDWILSADQIDLDVDADQGVARNAVLRFKNTPILATPWISFPLSDKRRSGLLVPTFSISNDDGFSYYQPIYLNLAPNYDATLTPIIMTKRGVGLGGEFRYLWPTFTGEFNGQFLPNDRLRSGTDWGGYWEQTRLLGAENVMLPVDVSKKNRWGYHAEHYHQLTQGMRFVGDSKLDIQLNRASDHNYWRDFPRIDGTLTSRLLNSEGTFSSYNAGFSSLVRVQRWQTLQDPEAYIVPPYDRTQLRLGFNREDQYGFDVSVMGDVTKFESDDITQDKTNATRGIGEFSLSYPMRNAGMFIVPKVKLTSRYYDFTDGILQQAGRSVGGGWIPEQRLKHKSVTVPNVSLDMGMIFERQSQLFGTDYVQTLEPRVMYSYSPYKNQSDIPLYDSSAYDYNLATIYLENPYVGYDRLADVNMITAGIGTRWLKPGTGRQVLSLNIAQRFRLSDQRVTIDEDRVEKRAGDLLLNASTELVPNWRFDVLTQFNVDESRSERHLLMARWKPGSYRAFNVAYRMQREASEQLDVSWQWPLGSPWMGEELPALSKSGGRWYTVGRVNYSLKDKKLVDGLFGLEYQSCCWIGRIVVDRVSTGRTKANTRLLFQLELSGLGRVGINPLNRLDESINNYQVIRNERLVRPNDFYLYDE